MVCLFRPAAALLAASLLLAGCAGSSVPSSDGPGPGKPGDIDATPTTGGIHGIVVDQAIRPLAKAAIEIAGPTRKNATTDDQGAFSVSGLAPGTYLVRASKPLYEPAQQMVEVVAGVRDPQDVKLQLAQVVFSKPYAITQAFRGFIECSLDVDGTLFSEECGEGVGVPCDVPVAGCQRAGGLESNHIQNDFYLPGDRPHSVLVETTWDRTVGAATAGRLRAILATDFVCDPTCTGNYLYDSWDTGDLDGLEGCTDPPVAQRNDGIQEADLTAQTRLTHFVWACGEGGTLPADVQVSQKYEAFVTSSYVLPLPEGWSFVAGSPNPFK